LISKNYAKLALVSGEKKYTYADLRKYSKKLSTLYQSGKEDKVAIYAENCPEWIFAFYSAWINKSILVPVDYLSTSQEVAHILNNCNPQTLFYSNETKEKIKEAIKDINYEIKLINLDETDLADAETIDYKYDLAYENENDTAVIIYTSGTTGSPKGVMLSFRNIIMNIVAVSEIHKIITEKDRLIGILPFHHTFPLVGNIILPFKVGAILALTPSLASEDILKTLQNNKITVLISVPRFYDLIQKGIRKKLKANKFAYLLYKIAKVVKSRNFSKKVFKKIHANFGGAIETMVCGGAPLNPETASDFITWGFSILEGFGMTECAPMISFTRPEDIVVGSCGKVIGGGEIKISESGEVLYRGDNVMKGYYKAPKATAEAIKDDWLYTGDLGNLDENGNLYITGRKKDIIVLSNGKNINPVEIEEAIIKTAEEISEIGVFNVRDVLQTVIYPDFVLLKNNGITNPQEYFETVVTEFNKTASSYRKINKVTISEEELPKTRLSKIQRYKLADFSQHPADKSKTPEPDSEDYKIIKNYLVKLKEQIVYADDNFDYDLALDSLDKVNLIVFIQNSFGIELETDKLSVLKTIKKLSEYISENKTKTEIEEINWTKILQEKLDIKLPTNWFTHTLLIKLSKPFVHLYFRITSEGKENLPDSPCIIAPNHQSYFDGLFISLFLKNRHLRKTFFYAKEKHIKQRWLKFLANRHGIIIMDINKDLKQSIQKMAAALSKGKNIMIFPEGTRSNDGSLGKFKQTFAILSRELNVPVIPVAIKGASEALPKGKKLPRPWKKVTVKFLKPIYPEKHTFATLRDKVYNKVLAHIKS